MKLKLILITETIILIALATFYFKEIKKNTTTTIAEPAHTSPYVDDLDNEVKTLSQQDLGSLREGSGVAFGGMAKAAELNGYPGPRHVLDIASELDLTDDQADQINKLFEEMQEQAIILGAEIIETEIELNNSFTSKDITEEKLSELVKKSADLYAQLRTLHLKYHLLTSDILSEVQIATYNTLRGYNNDPCENIPEGHDPEMWKLHNNCE